MVLTNHHLEASSETFFTHSMTADCVVGTVTQYAQKFSYLFHSISQAIYYNSPNYIQHRQLPLVRLLELTTENRGPRSVIILPLLLELTLDIPVLFEHKGGGHRKTHTLPKWALVLWVDFAVGRLCAARGR